MPDTLAGWLEYIGVQHPRGIELGLERVAAVRERMDLRPGFPVITVAGTNGKGSTCAMLEAILERAGYRVGCYTSPHLVRYNERVRIARREARDAELVAALRAVEQARGDTALTYFEYGTLAALWLFAGRGVDAAVLEVGLGGRLDAVNAFDADAAVLTSIDLDHMDYLGDTREAIGREKAGVFRAGRPAVVAERDLPATVVSEARRIGARLIAIGRDFDAVDEGGQWRYTGPGGARYGLPHPALRGAYQLGNAAAALAALGELAGRLPVSAEAIRSGLLSAELAGRFQVLPGRPLVILDVAHNPHAARALAASLAALPPRGRTLAVFAMLGDKDVTGVVRAVKERIDEWHLAPIHAPRGAGVELLERALLAAAAFEPAHRHANVASAYRAALDAARPDDKIVVFGSFLTVSAVLSLRDMVAA
jgi:dihydrofolate synthase/folylpolyglutamate synthase